MHVFWSPRSRTGQPDLLNPVRVRAPRLPVQDRLSLWRRVQRLCRCPREASFSRAQYGCRLSWVYCRGSQQCWCSSLQLWARRLRSGRVRWLSISWTSWGRKMGRGVRGGSAQKHYKKRGNQDSNHKVKLRKSATNNLLHANPVPVFTLVQDTDH